MLIHALLNCSLNRAFLHMFHSILKHNALVFIWSWLNSMNFNFLHWSLSFVAGHNHTKYRYLSFNLIWILLLLLWLVYPNKPIAKKTVMITKQWTFAKHSWMVTSFFFFYAPFFIFLSLFISLLLSCTRACAFSFCLFFLLCCTFDGLLYCISFSSFPDFSCVDVFC